MKKISIVLALVFAMVNFCVCAEGTPMIKVSSGEAAAGDTVDITVSLSDNPGIISMLLDVAYDGGAMKLTGVKDAGVLGDAVHSDMFSLNPYRLFWSNGTATSDFKVNGTIVTLTFEIAKDAKTGEYPVKVEYSREKDGIFNYDFENVDFGIENGKISVKGSASGDSSDSTVATGTDTTGETIKTEGNDTVDEVFPREPGEILVTIDDARLIFPDQKPVIKDDRTLVPLRAIFEALGATVDWDDATRTVTSVKGDITISLTIESDQLYVNGEAKTIDVPAQIINDRTMVPIRAIAESFGCIVDWDGETRTVIIKN